ncbi:sortase A [Ruminococcaceae bacterium R-25]|nr:sortase A [Ruminococcaceae bacterium R-25]SUQ21551.1 sortase A [Oscillospiraceae bacterium]
MKGRWLSILIVVLIVAGAALLLYPTVSNYLHSKYSASVIKDYHTVYQNTEEEKRQDIIRKAEDYNTRLFSANAPLYEPTQVTGYNDTLDLTGTGVMGYIDIDKIGVELPIYHGVDAGVLQIGVGHLEGSSLPVGGVNTHCILSGHRGLPSAKLFTDLNEMAIGDRFTITVLDRVLTYEVDQIKVVLPEDASELAIEEGKDYCTLVTCTPYGINTHRLLVRGIRVDGEITRTPDIFVSNEAFKIDKTIVATVIALPLFITVTLVAVVIERRRSGHDKKHKNV